MFFAFLFNCFDSLKQWFEERKHPILIQLNENEDSEYKWVFSETITTTSAPSNTSEFYYEYLSSNYVYDTETASMQWVYTYRVYKRINIGD